MKKIYAIDPTSHADADGNPTNLGDIVIKDAISKLLASATLDPIWVPFGTVPDGDLVIGGANVLAKVSLNNKYTWNPLNFLNFKHKLVLFGVGWWQYQGPSNIIDRRVFRKVLNQKNIIHSVRDSYTRNRLQEMGVTNVLNTSCPTTYFIEDVNNTKKEEVVFTLTDYFKDILYDSSMIDILLNNYSKVYFFPQGSEDLEYIRSLGYENKVEIMKPTIKDYDKLLDKKNIDYVGTRLHGGIRAHQKKSRAIILSVDNRAEEIKKDINLNVVKRGDLSALEKIINHPKESLRLKKIEMNIFLKNLKSNFN
jgi:polysaccharide pyruvyl transferase WcaK-like protein